MKQQRETREFRRDLKRSQKRGKNPVDLTVLVKLLLAGEALPEKNRDHQLTGNYIGCRECHIHPDWLLIYEDLGDAIVLMRAGSHADLFGK